MGILLHLQATRDLLKRYGDAIRIAWEHRKEMDSPMRLPHEAEFLPASLSLQETPVSPAPRVAMWLLIAFAVIAVLWSIFGRIDVVATAQGKIVPNDRVKTIQPVDTAAVTAIYVTDGKQVNVGEVLMELDATAANADTLRLQNELVVAILQGAKAEAILKAMDGGEAVLKDLPDIDPKQVADAKRQLAGEWAEYRAKLDRVEADISRREGELRSMQEVVKKLEQTVPIDRYRAEVFEKLKVKDVVSEQQYLDKKKTWLDQEGELAAQRQKQTESEGALREVNQQKAVLIAETRRTNLDTRQDADQKVTSNSQELAKAKQRGKLMKLVAPVGGTVQQLAMHTVGGVVTPAQQLMIIVPKDDAIEVEALVENKDIGFVEVGQEAEIKIETFQYTKYGTIRGRVMQVSNDAIQDDQKGLVYSSRVRLDKSNVLVEDKLVNLGPGMAVTVEIKTGKRRVIEFFLTPLMQHANESLRER